MPSTPVRTGRPEAPLLCRTALSFDPCSHRETTEPLREVTRARLPPLFAQGDQGSLAKHRHRLPSSSCYTGRRGPWRGMAGAKPSTPVRTGRPGAVTCTARGASFDPCSHRGTDCRLPSHNTLILRPLFAQGDRVACIIGCEFMPSTPVRTGGPLFPNLLNYIRFTNCTPSKSTTTRRRFAPT